jgi:hypothetical protein
MTKVIKTINDLLISLQRPVLEDPPMKPSTFSNLQIFNDILANYAHTVSLTSEKKLDILQAFDGGQKLLSIKIFKEASFLGLKESKFIMDKYTEMTRKVEPVVYEEDEWGDRTTIGDVRGEWRHKEAKPEIDDEI